MRTLVCLAVLSSSAALAADSDFNGRWDITAQMQRPRAWWVELNGVGTAAPSGKFVSAYNGDMNNIDKISVENGEVKWIIVQAGRGGGAGTSYIYRARMNGARLEGTYEVEGRNNAAIKWTAVRAPVIAEKDDGSWKEGKPVELFNGKDLSGWKALNPGAEMKWSVQDGILRNAPPTTDIISEQKFWNFVLHIDFRIVEHSNSGIGLRGRYEIQVLDDYGKPPNSHGAGALYARFAPKVNASKPPGEWQTYDIRLVGRQLTVVHNGTKVLDKVEVEGLTAIANNSDEAEPGPFIVQGDHSNIEIKSFRVTPLVK